MGALAPLPQWIPEDDLLLRNAVEAGASLESLAKGAVRFSRRFSIQELQDRWHSLLYDADISAEASARMVEIEIELSVSNNPKPNKSCSSKVKEWKPGKRKGDSLYCHYYTMRKKVRKDPCKSASIGFLVPPGKHVYIGGDSGCREQLKSHHEHLVGNCVVGETTSGQFEIPEAGFNIGQDAFPEMLKVDSDAANVDVAAHDFHKEAYVNSVEVPDGIVGKDGLYGFSKNASSVSVDKGVRDNAEQSFEHNSEHKDSSQILGESLTAFQNCSTVQEFEPQQTLPTSNSYEVNDFEKKPLSNFNSVNDNCVPSCSSFGGNQSLSSEVAGCSGSFHHLGYSSPLAAMSIWGTIDENLTPAIPVGGNFEDNEHGVSQAAVLPPNDDKKMSSVGYVHNREPKLQDGVNTAALTDSIIIAEGEGEFMDFSLNFSNDDDLFLIDGDGKDLLDASCLDGLNVIFSNSPGDTHQENVVDSTDSKAVVILNAHNVVLDDACPRDSKDFSAQIHSGYDDMHNVIDSAQNVKDISSDTCSSSKPLEGFVYCTLNTEDPEIPYNDDTLLDTQMLPSVASTDLSYNSEVTGLVSSSNVFSDDLEPIALRLAVGNADQKISMQPLTSSLNFGPKVAPKVCLMHLNDEFRIKAELPKSDSFTEASKRASIAADDTNHTSAPVAPLSSPIVALKEETLSLASRKCGEFNNSADSFLEASVQGYHANIYSLNIADRCKQEADKPCTLQKCMPLNAELGSGENGFMDHVRIAPTSDQEEQLSDSENEVPYFSDIEAMILDMDLDPSDQESSFFSREVSRYQYVDTKKAIIRLEQGAHSYMQRAIVSHGAFAIFYGRHLKHYIKKPEVSLGRATEDVNVDIDLGREGPANKISRRQAIIKMDEYGSFQIKNTGKCAVLVNGKDVLVGQQFNLSSGCLIEIRGMKFIFEVDQNSVRQYLFNVARKSSHEQNSRLDWSLSEVL